MGISILEQTLQIPDEELGKWLWQFPICCGITKRARAEKCARSARRAVDLMLEQRQQVLEAIQDRLAPHGFDVEGTYRDWIAAFQRIVELSTTARGDCFWSAPAHTSDSYKNAADAGRLMDVLERTRSGLHGDGNVE